MTASGDALSANSEPSEIGADTEPFDFDAHGNDALTEYREHHAFYVALADAFHAIVDRALKQRDLKVSSVERRAKTFESFKKKAQAPSTFDPEAPKYRDPFREIKDLAGVRVITFLPESLATIDDVLNAEFTIIERSDKADALFEEERFGYRSIHYLVTLNDTRDRLPEYAQYRRAVVEIQVRTVLQHAWAEIEHDIQYKSTTIIPTEIRRRFMALAGLLEIADREFQAIQDADTKLTEANRAHLAQGQLDVEVTADTVRAYLDHRLGPDGRMAPSTYEWLARLLKHVGFETVEEVDRCIGPYNDLAISQAEGGRRRGQGTRFERLLLAGMGEQFIARHPFSVETWFASEQRELLELLRQHGIEVGVFDPSGGPGSTGEIR